jgi:hypothetical protein
VSIDFSTYVLDDIYINKKFQSLHIYGLQYEKELEKLSIVSEANFSNNTIDDDCENCWDHFYGTGKLLSFQVGAGIKYKFLKKYKINPYIESGLNYSFKNYSGTIQGGFSGIGKQAFDNNAYTIGIYGRFGFNYNFYKNLVFDISSSLIYGYRTVHYKKNTAKDFQISTINLLELGIGYKF